MAWLGLKTLAFIPLTRSNIPTDVPPPDWADQIMQRVYYDIDPRTSVDRSLRAYIHTVSSGLADLHVVVQPPQTIVGTGAGGTNVPPDALEATQGNQLRAQGYDGAAIVMLGGPGGGSTTGYWSRFCMSDNHGAWVGEIVHQTNLCNLPDLFDFTRPINLTSTFPIMGLSSTRSKLRILSGTRRIVCLPSTCSRKPDSRRGKHSQ